MDRIEQFCSSYHEFNDISEQRRSMQRRVLREAEARMGKPLEDFDADDLSGYLETLVADGLKPKTVAGRLYAVRPFLDWAWRKKLIPADRLMELKDIAPPRGASRDSKPNPYTRKEIAWFWREFDKAYPLPENPDKWISRWERGISPWSRVQPIAKRYQLEAIVSLALSGGLRREEIWRVGLDDLDPINEYVVVHGARKNPEGETEVRAVPWTSDWMHSAVERWLLMRERVAPDHDFTWLSLHGSYRKHKMRWNTYEMLVHGITPGWSYQRFRHTAATEMLRNGYELEKVQAILGHRRIQQTLAYAKIIPDDLVKRARKVEQDYSRAIAPPVAA